MLTGKYRQKGYDWWWHSLTAINEETGEVSSLLGILDPDGNSYVTQSATFKRSFADIADIFDDGEKFSIKKISGQTKAGRPYVNCVLA